MAKDDECVKEQIWMLKVYLHCEGCRNKIRRILQKIKGVTSVTVDMELQRVTVQGTVDADTLIKSLAKKGKRAELCAPPISQASATQNTTMPENPKTEAKQKDKEATVKPEKQKKKKKSVQFQDSGKEKNSSDKNSETEEKTPQKSEQNANEKEKKSEPHKKNDEEQDVDSAKKDSKKKGKKLEEAGDQSPAESCATEMRRKTAERSMDGGAPAGIQVMHNRLHAQPAYTYSIEPEQMGYSSAPYGHVAYDHYHVSAPYAYSYAAPSSYDHGGVYPQAHTNPYADDYATTLFSDENTNSCSVM